MGADETRDRTSVDTKMKQIKKGRSTNIFKVALLMMRRGKSSKASVHADVATKGLWRKFFGSTTTLRLKNNASASHPTTTKAAAIVPEDDQKHPPAAETLALAKVKPAFLNVNVKVEEKEMVQHPQIDNQQSSPSCASSSSCCEESRYASAKNLPELDVCDEDKEENGNANNDHDEDCQFDDSAGDSMIDIKAEMFITQFYEQMRIQNTETQTIGG